MNQELMILLVSLNEASSDARHGICQNSATTKCVHITCNNCLLQIRPREYTLDLINTARELAYEPRTNINTQFPVQVR